MNKLPKLNLDKLDARCYEVLSALQLAQGAPLTAKLIQDFISPISYACRGDIHQENLRQTLMQYLGKPLTPTWCQLLSRQVGARYEEMLARPLMPFDRPTRIEWVPIEIVKLTETTWNETKSGQQLTFFCLAGSPAGYTLKRKFPTRWLAWLAYQIGFSRRVMYQDDPQIFIGMRVWANIAPATDPQQTMDIVGWDVSPAMKKHNRVVAYRRLRFDLPPSVKRDGEPGPGACPFDLDSYCTACMKTAKECVASYRRVAPEGKT